MFYLDESIPAVFVFIDDYDKVVCINYYDYTISFLNKIGGEMQKKGLERIMDSSFLHYVDKRRMFQSLFNLKRK